MKLKKLTIRNFKGIEELSIELENISVVIGQNNNSKSTILEALKQFGSADKSLKQSLYHKNDTSKPISFHATFEEITTDEADLHGIRASLHKPTGNFIVRAIYNYGSDVVRASKVAGNEEHDLGVDDWDGKLGGGKGSHFLNVFPDIIYIPAVKNASDEVKNTSQHMKDLSVLYKEVIHSLEEYKLAEEKTKALQDKINKHNDEKIKYFESEIQTFLNEITSTSIKFNVDVEPLDEIVSTSVQPLFNFNGVDTELSHQGNGVQRTYLLSVFKGYRNYKKKYATEEQNKFNRPIIIAFEEPELYLHPQLARVLKDTLYDLADDGYFQVIATSHSPYFIDLSKPNRTLIKLSLDSEKKVFKHQVNSDIYGLPSQEKEYFQSLLRFNPNVNEVFFAENVILVEGDTEVITLKLVGEKLVDAGVLNSESYHRTTVINCNGKGTMIVMLNVLNNFGIKYTVIHDYDISECNSKGIRRSESTLKATLTLNHKIEKLVSLRDNLKFVFQYTFEDEMPPEYEKGSSKSFSAYDFFRGKDLKHLPVGLLDIFKSAFGLTIEHPLDHSNNNLLNRYSWAEINTAKASWTEPEEDYIIKLWV